MATIRKTFALYVANPARDGKIQVQAEAPMTDDDPLGLLGAEAAKFGLDERSAAIDWLSARGCNRIDSDNLLELASGGKFRATFSVERGDIVVERA